MSPRFNLGFERGDFGLSGSDFRSQSCGFPFVLLPSFLFPYTHLHPYWHYKPSVTLVGQRYRPFSLPPPLLTPLRGTSCRVRGPVEGFFPSDPTSEPHTHVSETGGPSPRLASLPADPCDQDTSRSVADSRLLTPVVPFGADGMTGAQGARPDPWFGLRPPCPRVLT